MCRQAVGVQTAALSLSCIPQQTTQSTEGDGFYAAAKRKILLAAMNDEGAIGFEILDGDPEPSGHRWRYGPLDLDGPASQLAAKIKNEIHLCAGRRAIEGSAGIIGRYRQQALQHEAFPTSSRNGMAEHIRQGAQAEQGMEEATVSDIDLGRFDQSFPHVGN